MMATIQGKRLKLLLCTGVFASSVLLPTTVLADRPKIRKHHKVPAKWKKIIAARAGVRPTSASTTNTVAMGTLVMGTLEVSSNGPTFTPMRA